MPSVLAYPIGNLPMTLADLTALLSLVGKENPKLSESRDVRLFIQACIEAQRAADGFAKDVLPIVPVDVSEV